MSKTALFYLFACNLLGGSSYVAVEIALQGFSAPVLVFWRTAIGAALFLPIALRALRSRKFTRFEWLGMSAVGVFGYAAPQLLGTWGQELSTATNAALLIGIEPVSIVLLSAWLLGERITALKTAAVLAGLAGALLIVSQGTAFHGPLRPQLRGDVLLIVQGFFWGLYSVIGKPVLRTVSPAVFTAMTTLISMIPITAFAWTSLSGPPSHTPGTAALGALLFLGVFVTFLATYSWNRALELVPASQLANFIFLQPLFGSALGVFFQADPFTAWSAGGAALILLGVYWASGRY